MALSTCSCDAVNHLLFLLGTSLEGACYSLKDFVDGSEISASDSLFHRVEVHTSVHQYTPLHTNNRLVNKALSSSEF